MTDLKTGWEGANMPTEVIRFKCCHCGSEYDIEDRATACEGIHVLPIAIESYWFDPSDLDEHSMRVVSELVSVPDRIVVSFSSRKCPGEKFTEKYCRKI